MKPIGSKCVFSIDVEDWFHILDVPSTPPLEQWDKLPSRVERNFFRMLEIAAEYDVRCSCFFIGWIAQRFPGLVKAAVSAGHEIASHGFSHQLAYKMTPQEFYEDAARAKNVLEQNGGVRVLGYRSAGFSLTPENTWVFDELLRAGYRYDASVFPAYRAEGGWQHSEIDPYEVKRPGGNLVEFPMTTEKVLGRQICFFGGGYLRLFPTSTVLRMTDRVLEQGRPVIFYVHPREIDPAQPRLQMSAMRRFRSYVNLGTTESKIRRILEAYDFQTFANIMAANKKSEVQKVRKLEAIPSRSGQYRRHASR